MSCIICTRSEFQLVKVECCNQEICLQCILSLENKVCPFCKCDNLKISLNGTVLDVKNTRGYTQADMLDDDDDVDVYDNQICIYQECENPVMDGNIYDKCFYHEFPVPNNNIISVSNNLHPQLVKYLDACTIQVYYHEMELDLLYYESRNLLTPPLEFLKLPKVYPPMIIQGSIPCDTSNLVSRKTITLYDSNENASSVSIYGYYKQPNGLVVKKTDLRKYGVYASGSR